MSFKDRLEIIVRDHDLRRFIADDLGTPGSRSGEIWFFRCPFHSDKTASFAAYQDHFHCYSCSASGDICNFVAMRTGKSPNEALDLLEGSNSLPKFIAGPAPRVERKPFAMTLNQVLCYRENLDKVEKYLESRVISKEVIDSNLLGCEIRQRTYTDLQGKHWNFDVPYVTIPYLFHEKVYSFNSRRNDLFCRECFDRLGLSKEFLRLDVANKEGLSPSEISDNKLMDRCFGNRFHRPGSPVTAYGVSKLIHRRGNDLVYPFRPYVIISEGEANEWSCESLGYACTALKPVERVDIPRLTQNVRMVFLAIDPDQAGEAWADKIMSKLGNDYAKVRKMILPSGFKDMNDLHKVGQLDDFLSRKPFFLEKIDPIRIPETSVLL